MVEVRQGPDTWDKPVLPVIAGPLATTRGNFRGIVVWVSSDGGDSYREVGGIERPGIQGALDEDQPGGAGIVPNILDRVSDVFAVIEHGTPQTVDICQGLTNCENLFLVGTEVMFIGSWELLDAEVGLWKGTNLLRGLRGTYDQLDTHETSEPVQELGIGTYVEVFTELSEQCAGNTLFLKAADPEADLDDVTAVEATPDRTSLRPMPPANFQQYTEERGANDTVTFTWSYVSRDPDVPLFSCEPMRNLEFQDGPSDGEQYQIQIRDPVNGYDPPLLQAFPTTNSWSWTGKTSETSVTARVRTLSELYDPAKGFEPPWTEAVFPLTNA